MKAIPRIAAAAALFVLAAALAGCLGSNKHGGAASQSTSSTSALGGARPHVASGQEPDRSVRGDRVRPRYSRRAPRLRGVKLGPITADLLEKEERQPAPYRASSKSPVRPRPGTQSGVRRGRAATDLVTLRAASVTPSSAISTMDPSGIVGGSTAFLAGNFFTAKSSDAGKTWTFINPFEMADFCCDQDFAYDKTRAMIIWVRQSWYDTNTSYSKLNRLKIASTTNGGSSWCYWDFTPKSMNSNWSYHMLDRPYLALTTKNLIVSSNMYAQAGATDTAAGAVVWRISLDSLKACGQLRPGTDWNYWKLTDWSAVPAQGRADTAYLASRSSNTKIRVFKLADSTTSMYYWDRTVPTFTSTPRGAASCALPNKKDPCKRIDDRIQTGWVSGSKVTFMWDVAQGSGFKYPYINAASFNTSDMAYASRPYLYNDSYATLDPAATVNARGDVAVSYWAMSSSTYPAVRVAIDDSDNGAPPPWEARNLGSSTGWGADDIGDYTRVEPVGNLFAVFGTTSSGTTYTPWFWIAGRDRNRSDLP